MSVFWYDISKAVAEAYVALEAESRRPNKDFGELVRQRRKARGLLVPVHDPVLPLRVDSAQVTPVATDAARHRDVDLRVQRALQTLEEAELRGASLRNLDALEVGYLSELGRFERARASWHT